MGKKCIGKFLADAAKDIPPELAEPYYQYAKSVVMPLVSSDMPPYQNYNTRQLWAEQSW